MHTAKNEYETPSQGFAANAVQHKQTVRLVVLHALGGVCVQQFLAEPALNVWVLS